MFVPVIPAGTDAPGFELPGLIDGAHRPVALEEFLGEDVVILAFYPADFNPACDAESDLDELDLFTMQKDVSVLAVGPDTLYSHAAFAEEYDLHVPLLSDTSHEVAETYGVAFEDEVGQRLIERAVFVVDHDGVIQYAWSTRDMTELPRSGEIKDAIADTGGDDTAFARYRVGHAHYTEGRRAFTSAMNSYRDSEWMVAQSDFRRAREEFEEAAEHYDSSVRFVDDETFEAYYERAEEKATALWQAADWLGKSASEYSSGRGAEGQRLRDDAENPLETARDLGEPIDPDDWPPETDGEGRDTFLPSEDDDASALTLAIDDAVAESDAEDGDDADGESDAESGTDGGDEIDDAELREIEAELAASQPENAESESIEEAPTSVVDEPPTVDDEPPTVDEGSPDGGASDEIDDDDLRALEAEMEASQSAADAANRADDAAGDGLTDDLDGGIDDDPLAGPSDAPLDPDADLSSGGSPAPGASRSLEPTAEPDASDGGAGATDEGRDAGAPAADEPQGASDGDLADIPTAEDLAAEAAEAADDERDGDVD